MNEFSSPSQYMHHVLSGLGVIAQQRNGLVSSTQDCEWIPFYMFRFSDHTDKSIYAEIKRCLEAFEGNLQWTLFYLPDQPPKRLYCITPRKYAGNCAMGRRKNSKGKLAQSSVFEDELYGEEVFIQTRNLAVLDTPKLIDWISTWFNIAD